ncbi:MAG: flagellar hook-basal body complex protein FliE [Terracidiphilus sp.]|nr:flagellar hook-basal body complex protein FliE [Terracidiphilus sp.]
MQPVMNAVTSAVSGLSNLASNRAGAGPGPLIPAPAGGADQPAPFSDLLTDAVGQVNQLEDQAHTAVTGLMTGTGVDVHEAMIATQKASMAFELALAVRNKAVQAYQSVMGMQF